LAWENGGLVNLHFPWDRSRWTNSVGYNRTKDFYVFKHYSAFIHPGWKRIGTSGNSELLKTAAFISSTGDSAAFVAINRSATDSLKVKIQIPGFEMEEATTYSTSEENNFITSDYLNDTILVLVPRSINTVDIRLSSVNSAAKIPVREQTFSEVDIFPNPFSQSAQIRFVSEKSADYSLEIFDLSGSQLVKKELGFYPPGKHQVEINSQGFENRIYFFRLFNSAGQTTKGKFVVTD
jgi:hypothetical protein